MTDGLKDAHREAIIAALTANNRVERAVLFGSRATGTNTVTSDVDIALFGDRLTLTDQARLAAAVDEIPMAQPVDLILYDSVRDRTLREHIQNDGVEWFTREHSAVTEAVEKAAIRRTDLGNSGKRSDWRESSWGDEISLEYGKARRGHANSTGPFRVFGSNGPIGWTDTPLAPGPGVVLGRKGAYRGVAYSPDPFFVIDTAYYVASKSKHDMRWLFYAIKHYKLGEIDDGSPIPSTTRAAVYPCKLAVPSLHEQRAIAHVLGTFDDKIELNRRMNETLEGVARALFKSWFVDFDPVRAKMEGRDTGLPRDIADLFPDRMMDSELGDIPDGWEVMPLGDLVELAYGKPLPKRKRRPGCVPVYGSNGQVDWHDQQLVDGPGVVVGRKGNPGLVRWSLKGFFPIDTTFYVVPKDEGLGMFFLFHLLRTQDLPSIASDSAVPGMNRNLAYMNRAVVPSKDTVGVFTKTVKAISVRQYGLQQESRTLAGLRDTLLPKLMSGAIRVPGAERLAESVP